MDTNKLQLLGFNDFVHLRLSEQDGKSRMKWSGFIKYGEHISFTIVKQNDQWQVEKINVSGKEAEQLIKKYIHDNKLDEVINFIENVYRKLK